LPAPSKQIPVRLRQAEHHTGGAAEVAVSRQMFKDILMLIAQLRARAAPASPEDRVRCDR
jgi:hypothetical protein